MNLSFFEETKLNYIEHSENKTLRFRISGLVDATSACCGRGKLNAESPCLPTAKVCSDRTKYLFWDYYGHPTEAGSRVIAELMSADDSQYMFPLSLSQLVALRPL